MSSPNRNYFLDLIRQNIEKSGLHLYSVAGGESPRYLYTIGLFEKLKFELILPGLATVPVRACAHILNTMEEELTGGVSPQELSLELPPFGTFSLGPVHHSWSKPLMLGALDYYNLKEVKAWQVVPDKEHGTIDVPSMAFPFNKDTNPVWQWMDGGWPYSVPSDTHVVADLDMMKGFGASEVMRWEEDEWQMFSRSQQDIPKEEMFPLPLATLIAFDPSLEAILDIEVGTGLYREYEVDRIGPWKKWVVETDDQEPS